jgi:hypothetical protein
MAKHLPAIGVPALLAIVLMAGMTPACADEGMALGTAELETVNAEMLPEIYHRVYRRNQRQLRKVAKTYTMEMLRSAGVPETGIRLMGTVAGVAAGSDVNFKLAKSRYTRLALEFQDVIETDRRAMLELRFRW